MNNLYIYLTSMICFVGLRANDGNGDVRNLNKKGPRQTVEGIIKSHGKLVWLSGEDAPEFKLANMKPGWPTWFAEDDSFTREALRVKFNKEIGFPLADEIVIPVDFDGTVKQFDEIYRLFSGVEIYRPFWSGEQDAFFSKATVLQARIIVNHGKTSRKNVLCIIGDALNCLVIECVVTVPITYSGALPEPLTGREDAQKLIERTLEILQNPKSNQATISDTARIAVKFREKL